jgi:rhamnose utilization protein RhaD (predicted bifunctional aldolase and dehydrogenase)/NAD(P)-dependent dehydrogenase (short-subunit alcohol dehydrogenase family)
MTFFSKGKLVQSLWNETEAAQHQTDLDLRVYTSRLLGKNPALVLHGGGNTSVKTTIPNLFGEPQDILYIKGSGWDLATIEAKGFAPARLNHLRRLATLDALPDLQMANELQCALIDASAPAPSVEAILHALIPHRFVDHTHADAIIALTNNLNGREHVQNVFGDEVVVIPYVMPGFRLAKLCAEEFPRQYREGMQGMILLHHGIFTFGDTALESYERMIALVSRAEAYLTRFTIPAPMVVQPPQTSLREELANLRKNISGVAGKPMLLTLHQDEQAWEFVQQPELERRATQGPLTPDHVIRTKLLPMIGLDVDAYAAEYQAYFDTFAPAASQPLTMLDPAPRIALVPEWGLITIGQDAKEPRIAEDIYRHTMHVITQAEAVSGYSALPAQDIFQVEYWDLEQAKLKSSRKPLPFAGEVALVTGGASGIGKACVEAMLARGAAVVSLDLQPGNDDLAGRPDYYAIKCDVSDEAQVANALETAVRRFGGLDMVVLNAGIFPPGTPIAKLALDAWEKVMSVNLNANLLLLRLCHPLLKASPRTGRVVVVASKNVPAPGPGAAAYSASKAALTQLARVAAMEWGADGIRINVVHPNAVFDTGIWNEEVLAARAKNYDMSVDAYKTNNVLKVEITSKDVGELVATLCDEPFSRTTGAQIPIDGGNDRVI